MELEIVLTAALIIFMAILILVMLGIYRDMKRFLSNNIEEVLIISAETIEERMKIIDDSVSGVVKILQSDNKSFSYH